MLISISNNYSLIVSALLVAVFIFLGYLFLFRKQDGKLNWAIFYATLYSVVTLPIVNYLCVEYGLWHFPTQGLNTIQLPFDLYFLWIVLWAIIPVFFLKGKYVLLIAGCLFWIDILVMPELEKIGILSLGPNWLIGELLLILFVFVPAYCWANASYTNKQVGLRALFQITVMCCVFLIGLPLILETYGLIESNELGWEPYTIQFFLILVFPSLIAVQDLVKKGEGTPFPYDATKHLIQTGVYAYCRNPIQWSFSFMFMPLAIYYASFYLLIGTLFSIAYAFGVSDFQEYDDMQKRFGEDWDTYKKNVPKWWFLWKPTAIPKGEIFFDANCAQCSQISEWFLNVKAINLDVKTATEFPYKSISQVTYIDHNGIQYKSVSAIACSLEHINLAYATLGWFMRFPIVNHILQVIIDSMGINSNDDNCAVK